MRIAYVLINANQREGTSRAVIEVARRLADIYPVTLYTRSADDIDFGKIDVRKLRGPAWPDVLEFSAYRMRVEYAVKSQAYDIIHSAGCNIRVADVYAIQTVHPAKMKAVDTRSRNKGVSFPQRITRYLYDRVVCREESICYKSIGRRGALGYIPVSKGAAVELCHQYPVSDALVEVIPNGADVELFRPELRGEHLESIRQEFQLKSEDFVLLFVGGEWPRKGLGSAIIALSKIKDQRVHLLIAGDDPLRDHFKSMATDLGVSDRIRWAGFRSDIHRFYAAADLFLLLSKYEAFCVATIEAAASGLPVVMTNVSGAEELLGDGIGGQIVSDSPDEIAKAVQIYSSDSLRLKSASAEIRSKVERSFTWDAIADKTLDFYRKLLKHRSNSAGNS